MTTELRTRKPTGKPSWPILLIAGAEKAGKSYSAALATGSPLIGRSYWITIGEDEPDEYGQLGDFDIVEHDGTYRGILEAIQAAGKQHAPAAGAPLLIVDSMTRLWNLITSNVQEIVNQRARKRGKASQDQDAQITMDLWNLAADQWTHVMDAVRAFPGPSILTARLDVVAVMNDAGQPTPQKTTKVQAHKSLPYDAGAVIEMPARGETYITGVRSVRLKLDKRKQAPADFTVDWFWRQLGLHELETGPRDHNGPRVAVEPAQAVSPAPAGRPPAFDPAPWEDQIALATDLRMLRRVFDEASGHQVLGQRLSNGDRLGDSINRAKARLEQDARAHAVEPAPEPEYEPQLVPDYTTAYDDETPF